jgi:predicted component of viral defense system (DUF524 family)
MKYTLIQVIQHLENKTGKKVVFIEYEDGSGKSFNYKLMGDPKNQYIRFK